MTRHGKLTTLTVYTRQYNRFHLHKHIFRLPSSALVRPFRCLLLYVPRNHMIQNCLYRSPSTPIYSHRAEEVQRTLTGRHTYQDHNNCTS